MTIEEWMKEDPSIKRFEREAFLGDDFIQAIMRLGCKINRDEFEGHAPETVMFSRLSGTSGFRQAKMVFFTKPQSWNHAFREDKGVWDEIRSVDTDETPFQVADFSKLSGMIAR